MNSGVPPALFGSFSRFADRLRAQPVAYAGDAGRRVPRASLQVHGGIGFMWDDLDSKRGEAKPDAYGDGTAQREQVAALTGL